MLLSKSLVMAMKSYDISGVKVLCDGSIREKAAKTFVDKFKSKWNNALDLVEEECGNCTTKEKKHFPLAIQPTEYGFFVKVVELDIKFKYRNCNVQNYNLRYSAEALEEALMETKQAYSGLEYEGYCGCIVSDIDGMSLEQWEIPFVGKEDTDKKYEFVGEALNRALKYEANMPETEFWIELEEQLESTEDFEETIRVLCAYAQWIDEEVLKQAIDRIIEFADSLDEGLHETLVEEAAK